MANRPGCSAAARTAVRGLDVHPVAVIISRVTWLPSPRPPAVLEERNEAWHVPVYLGDTNATVHRDHAAPEGAGHPDVPPPPEGADLKFPEVFCKDIHLFDKLVARMRQGSEQKMTARQIESAFKLEIKRHYKRDLTKAEAEGVREMVATYVTFDELCRQGRDLVWTYVARNLSRPLALSFGAGWANVVVGNPPWVAFRHMSADSAKAVSRAGQRPSGSMSAASSRPRAISRAASFTARAPCPSTSAPAARIAFVLPLAALTRGQFEKLRERLAHQCQDRSGRKAWTMDDDVQPLFPVPLRRWSFRPPPRARCRGRCPTQCTGVFRAIARRAMRR